MSDMEPTFSDMFNQANIFRVRQMLGNMEDIKDYHKKVLLPKMEKAVGDAKLMRFVVTKLLSEK